MLSAAALTCNCCICAAVDRQQPTSLHVSIHFSACAYVTSSNHMKAGLSCQQMGTSVRERRRRSSASSCWRAASTAPREETFSLNGITALTDGFLFFVPPRNVFEDVMK